MGFATDGTPVDCVRFATLGLVDGFTPDLIVSGINHGSNLGDDITYSGTVAAAFEGLVLGVPAIAVSQQSTDREMDFRFGRSSASRRGALHRARRRRARRRAAARRDAAEHQRAGRSARRASRSRAWASASTTTSCSSTTDAGSGRRRYWIYGADPGFHDEPGTDLAAVAEGRISVTPVHFDLTDVEGIDALAAHDLTRLLAPAARELE